MPRFGAAFRDVMRCLFSFPANGSKRVSVQHMANILCAVLLGSGYSMDTAAVPSCICNLLGLGDPMVLPRWRIRNLAVRIGTLEGEKNSSDLAGRGGRNIENALPLQKSTSE